MNWRAWLGLANDAVQNKGTSCPMLALWRTLGCAPETMHRFLFSFDPPIPRGIRRKANRRGQRRQGKAKLPSDLRGPGLSEETGVYLNSSRISIVRTYGRIVRRVTLIESYYLVCASLTIKSLVSFGAHLSVASSPLQVLPMPPTAPEAGLRHCRSSLGQEADGRLRLH